MTKLTLTNCVQGYATLVENEFIDKYMAEANGEYVKVYLLLLRYKCDPSVNLGVSEIADILDCTEKDVNRALDYWTKKGLLALPRAELSLHRRRRREKRLRHRRRKQRRQ